MDRLTTHKTLKEALVNIKDYEYILPEEVHNASRVFHRGAHIDLFRLFYTSKTRKFHEVIFLDRPIKLFFDLESKTLSAEEFLLEAGKILQHFDNVGYKPPVIFDSSRPEKQSWHVIYHTTVFRNLKELEVFVERLFPNNLIIDMQVYKKSGTLRVPYATSHNSFPHVLLPRNGNNNFDKELFKMGILHYYNVSFFCNNSIVAKCTTNATQKLYSKNITNLNKWAFINGYRILTCKETNINIIMYVKGITCPVKKEKHKSNNTSIVIDLINPSNPSTYTCLDNDCNKAKWHGTFFSTIIRPSEIISLFL
jgi:hypothetical protein